MWLIFPSNRNPWDSPMLILFMFYRKNPTHKLDETAWCVHYTAAPKPRQVGPSLGQQYAMSPMLCSVWVLLYNKMKVKMAAC